MTTTIWRPPPRTLDDVRDPDDARDLFPRDVLEGAEMALCLFSAAFWGRQDAYWMAEAGIKTTCVDLDGDKLREMMAVYPKDWAFRQMDAWELHPDKTPVRYDVVSLDPFTDLFQRVADSLPQWCALALQAVILGHGTDTVVVPPEGWQITERIHRSTFSGGVWWSVLQPVKASE